MTKTKTTKRMFLTSVVAMLVCLAMLVGSTFAWFTDSKSTAVNTIQAGTLEIDIQDESGASLVGGTLDFAKAAGHTAEEILWEPGCTYSLPQFKVVNLGSLALKYKVAITGIDGDTKLNEVITWTVNGVDAAAEYHLLPNAASDFITITGHMDENAGNEYQGLTMNGIAITVIATQDTVEYDSTDNQYDANAAYASSAALEAQLAKGGNITLDSNVALTPKTGEGLTPLMTVTKDTTLDLAGKDLTIDPAAAKGNISGVPVFMSITEPVTVTINGDGNVNAEAGDNSSYCINVNHQNAVLNITGGNYYGAPTGIQVQQGTLNVSGGFFDMAPSCKVAAPGLSNYEINCIDRSFKDGTAKIVVTGGTFVNFDPSANPEGPGTSYVAEGYEVVSSSHGEDTWYTVQPIAAP